MRHRVSALVLAVAAVALLGAARAPVAAAIGASGTSDAWAVSGAAASQCTFGGFGNGPGLPSPPRDPSVIGVITGLDHPGGLAVDPVTGRVFIAELTSKRIAIVDGRASGGFSILAHAKVGVLPSDVAVDPGSGHVFVSDQANCQITVIDGRASPPSVIATLTVPGNPGAEVVDPSTGQLFVTLSAAGKVAVIGSDLSLEATLSVGVQPAGLAVDPVHNLVFVALSGGPDPASSAGAIAIIAAGGAPHVLPQSLPAAWPQDVAFDPGSGTVEAVESGTAIISTLAVGADGSLSRVGSTPAGTTSQGGGSTPFAASVLTPTEELLVPIGGSSRLDIFRIAPDGTLTFERAIAKIGASDAPAVDSQTGRVFVSELSSNRVDVLAPGTAFVPPSPTASPPSQSPVPSASPSPLPSLLAPSPGASPSPSASASPSAGPSSAGAGGATPVPAGTPSPAATSAPGPTAPGGAAGPTPTPTPLPSPSPAPGGAGGTTPPSPPPLTFALPGPFDVSLAPVDVARSIGITVFLMLLVGAPSPIFNGTLGAHRELIGRWLRRRRPQRLASSARLRSLEKWLVARSKTWTGLALYVLFAALLYAFLNGAFPFQNGLRTFVTTLLGIVIGTAVSQVPGELYVRRHYKVGGKVRVALWTLGLAAVCVVITRVTGTQPGYVYGIIGGFTFGIALTADDKGRMAFRGMTILLAVGIAAWFLRVPFQPTAADAATGGGSLVNDILAGIFISAIEGSVIGLIPLRFLAGEALFTWRRRRWAALWAIALLLFAHVILYPVSSFEPNPSTIGIWTIAATVAIYSAIALGFWWFWRRRDDRKHAYLLAAQKARLAETAAPVTSAADAASLPDVKPTGEIEPA